jgi:hypothetical protein
MLFRGQFWTKKGIPSKIAKIGKKVKTVIFRYLKNHTFWKIGVIFWRYFFKLYFRPKKYYFALFSTIFRLGFCVQVQKISISGGLIHTFWPKSQKMTIFFDFSSFFRHSTEISGKSRIWEKFTRKNDEKSWFFGFFSKTISINGLSKSDFQY